LNRYGNCAGLILQAFDSYVNHATMDSLSEPGMSWLLATAVGHCRSVKRTRKPSCHWHFLNYTIRIR